MKRRGAISDFTAQRNRELLQTFHRLLRDSRGVALGELFGMTARSPASRFWVSELRAAEVISAMMRGEQFDNQVPQKRRMYEELYRRVKSYMGAHAGCRLSDAVFAAVNSPAPEFYLTDKSAKVIIYELRRNRRKG